MQQKHILIVGTIIAACILVSWLRSRNVTPPVLESPQQVFLADLANGERHVYDLLREVHGHAILTESFVREAGDTKVSLILDTNKTAVSSLEINLSSLARKQKDEGLSDGAVKKGFTF